MSNLRASEAHLLELRKIHSMLHASMDALIKDLNANEAARLLILLDDRLTSLINSAEVDREARLTRPQGAEPSGEPARPVAEAASAPLPQPAAAPPRARTPMEARKAEPAAPPPAAKAEPPPAEAGKAKTVAPPPAETEPPPAEPPVAARQPAPPLQDIPSAPIMAVPEPTAAAPLRPTRTPPPEETPREAAKPEPAPPQEAPPQEAPAREEAPAEQPEPVPAPAAKVVKPAAAPPPAAKVIPLPPPPPPPAAAVDEPDEELDDEPDFVEEDLDNGEDLEEELEEQDRPKRGLAGLLSKFRLPGFSRRRDSERDEPPDDRLDDEPPDDEELFPEDEEDEEDEAPASAASERAFDVNLRRLHAAVDQLASNHLLDEAAARTGNRIELTKVETGLDLRVKGLPTPLGTVRLSEIDGHVVYQPKFGLDLPDRDPNRADLEIWMKAMGDIVVRVLEDIAARRKSRGGPSEAGG